MSDRYWGQITIGGTITKKVWEALKVAIIQDVGGYKPIKKKNKKIPDYLILEEDELPNGAFPTIEETCYLHEIPFQRRCSGNAVYGQDPELYVFTPSNKEDNDHSYTEDNDHDIVAKADELMKLRNALKEITLSNAPVFVGDMRWMHQDYAKHLLSGKDPMEFMIKVLDDYLPPNIPQLPKFRVKGLK